MGCGSSCAGGDTQDALSGMGNRQGSQILPADFTYPKTKANRKNVEGTAIVTLAQEAGHYTMHRTRLPANAFGKREMQRLAKGHATLRRGPPAWRGGEAGEPGHEHIARALVVPDFAHPFVLNISAVERDYLKTMTVKKLQKIGAVTYRGSFSVEFTEDDPGDPPDDATIAALSPKSSYKRHVRRRDVELTAVADALSHLYSHVAEPRTTTAKFRGATLRPLSAFDAPVSAIAIIASEREISVGLNYSACTQLSSSRSDLLQSRSGVRVIDVFTGMEMATYRNSRAAKKRILTPAYKRLAYCNEETILVSLDHSGVVLWDTVKRAPTRPLVRGKVFNVLDTFTTCKVSACGKLLAVGGHISKLDVGAVSLYRDDRQYLNFLDHLWRVTALDFSPCGEWVASADKSGEVVVWSARTGSWRGRVDAHLESVVALVFTSSDALITMCGKYVKLWSITAHTGAPSYRIGASGRLTLVWERSVGIAPRMSLQPQSWPDSDTLRTPLYNDSRSEMCGMTPTSVTSSPMGANVPTKEQQAQQLTSIAAVGLDSGVLSPGGGVAAAPPAFTSATLTPCALLAVTHNNTEVLLMDPATGCVVTSVRTAGIPTAVAAGRAMCAIGDALGNVYALDIDTSHSLPGPSNPLAPAGAPRAASRARGSRGDARAPSVAAAARSSRCSSATSSP